MEMQTLPETGLGTRVLAMILFKKSKVWKSDLGFQSFPSHICRHHSNAAFIPVERPSWRARRASCFWQLQS
jgi:hypothetical protein